MTKLRGCVCEAGTKPMPRVEYRWKGKERKGYYYFCTSCLLVAEAGENIPEAMSSWNDMIKKKKRALKEVNKRKAKK